MANGVSDGDRSAGSRPSLIGDGISEELLLGFEDYLETLVSIISNRSTDDPMVIGIYGSWGSGKSTLMDHVRKKLSAQEIVTVWFEAWKYNREDAVWAAFLQLVTSKVVEALGPFQRLRYRIKAHWHRIRWKELPSGLVLWLLRVGGFIGALLLIGPISSLGSEDVEPYLRGVGSLGAYLLGGWTILRPVLESLKDMPPFNLQEYYETSDFKEHIALIDSFHEDFEVMVESLPERGNNKLVVFIDDLDRCKPDSILQVLDAG